jgi:hypothetical protein
MSKVSFVSRLHNLPEMEADWIVENFFDSKESYRALEQLVKGRTTIFQFLQWFELFVEGSHESFLEYKKAVTIDARRTCVPSEQV